MELPCYRVQAKGGTQEIHEIVLQVGSELWYTQI